MSQESTPSAAESPAYCRLCPRCGSSRSVDELYCRNRRDEDVCNWPLFDEPIVREGAVREGAVAAGPSPEEPPTGETPREASVAAPDFCVNGHPLDAFDEICFVCGGERAAPSPGPVAADAADEAGAGTSQIEGWTLLRHLGEDEATERFLARAGASGEEAEEAEVELTLYRVGCEPDQAVQAVLRRMPLDHVPRFVAAGRFEGRAFEVTEHFAGGTLEGLAREHFESADLRKEWLLAVVDEISNALSLFGELSLRHRDLHPGRIVVRSREPLDLVITGFGSARLSDFDLESVAPLELTRYSAPEAIVGAVSAASDWWSLGMIVLELATAGSCFEGIHDQAFRLHVVTRGIPLPAGLDPQIRLLLRGLLVRDPLQRWSATQVRAWLAGESVEAPHEVLSEEASDGIAAGGKGLALAGRVFRRPELFALAAAESQNWDAARELTLRGSVATWLAERGGAVDMAAQVRRLVGSETLDEDFRHALVLMALNPALPLTMRGELVTPSWLLGHPREAYELITGEVTRHLERMGRESLLVRLRTRAEQVRERAKLLGVELSEEQVRVALLATSRANLEAERDALRRIWPDTDHPGLASLLGRSRLSDEDLIVLVSAALHQFLPLESLLQNARDLAAGAQVDLDEAVASDLLVRPRREIFAVVEERLAHFARCGHPLIDSWADEFRVERRMLLPRAVVLLAVPPERWQEPPKQQYLANLLDYFEKRVAGVVSRGPLARFVLGKTTPRVDLAEVGTGLRPAEALLNHVLSRDEVPISLDPSVYLERNLDNRLRRLASQAIAFRRDTGLDGRYLGFPFLLLCEARSGVATLRARPRFLPVLLWPVVFEMPPGFGVVPTLMFDRGREEIRLNPALEAVLAPEVMKRWREAREELLARPALRLRDVLDVFGSLAPCRQQTLTRLPERNVEVDVGSFELLPSAALFNAEFTGQSVAEDLRRMRNMPPAGTGLEALLRVASTDPAPEEMVRPAEQDRYLVVASDPSQEAAVQRSRYAPGLLVEGPPGTGKSQTIVNVIADTIGRGDTVLVVCQKQAALQVVKKRLEAEGLGNRLFMVVDVNRDRELVVKSLREQLLEARQASPEEVAAIRGKRQEKAARIEVIEAEIDSHHRALHAHDEPAGASYRELLGELLVLEASVPVEENSERYLEVPGLRRIFEGMSRAVVSRLEEVCSPLAPLWLDSAFEGSPLAVLSTFSVDAAQKAELEGQLRAYLVAEEARQATLLATPRAFETEDPQALEAWLQKHSGTFLVLSAEMWRCLATWQTLSRAKASATSMGEDALRQLEATLAQLEALPADQHDAALFAPIAALPPVVLHRLLQDAERVPQEVSFLGRLSPWRFFARRRLEAFLSSLGEEPSEKRVQRLRGALDLEQRLRPLRATAAQVHDLFGSGPRANLPTLQALRQEVGQLLSVLLAVKEASAAVDACPRPQEAAILVAGAKPEGFTDLRRDFESAIERHADRERSLAALLPLEPSFSAEFFAQQREKIRSGGATREAVEPILGALGTLAVYQQFRLRAQQLEPAAMPVFAALRAADEKLRRLPRQRLEEVVRRTLRREALLAFKGRLESQRHELHFEPRDLERRVEALAELDGELRELNRTLLGSDLQAGKQATAKAWEELTRLRGARRRTLRELIAEGRALGLLELRPIWLMNPDVASRMLPLEAGLFDLVIYDEASQMPVEYALPTLFRARRVFISGDEKQMPPTSFFSAVLEDEDDDEELDFGLLDEARTEAERLVFEEKSNRREVKDFPDLLQLGRSSLPQPQTLEIHYRSQYRELIAFSNAAFYRGSLSVPVRHPAAEVRRARPIEVVRVDGIYEEQTNAEEAARIVELVAEIWANDPEPPSLGVVTFNRKQADLIESAFATRAGEDEGFLRAFGRERERIQAGEDMSFFVKNVENVQGDERDVILFSTTFGRDRRGSFRRNFGVLGQVGGERRLNVAVTRARRKVVLVTSIPVQDVSDWLNAERPPSLPRDFLQAYLDYAERSSSGDLAEAATRRLGLTTSSQRRQVKGDLFLDLVGEFLRGRGWTCVRTEDHDVFNIDFAIEDERTGLFGIGIECDAPRQPLLERARAREIWRPEVLRRAIPVIHRVSSRNWYHRPLEEQARLENAVRAALAGPEG